MNTHPWITADAHITKLEREKAALLEALKDMTCKTCEHPWCDRARQVIRGIVHERM